MSQTRPDSPYVFISFPSESGDAKDAIKRILERAGIASWDYQTYSKKGRVTQFYAAMSDPDCRAVIALISLTALDSPDIVNELQQAIEEARNRGTPLEEFLFPISLGGLTTPLVKQLKGQLQKKAPPTHNLIYISGYKIEDELVPILQSIDGLCSKALVPSGDDSMTIPPQAGNMSNPAMLCRLAFKNSKLDADEYAMIREELVQHAPDKVNSSMSFAELAGVIVHDRPLFEYTIQVAEDLATGINDQASVQRFRELVGMLRGLLPHLPRGPQTERVEQHWDRTTPIRTCKLGECAAADIKVRLTDDKEPAVVYVNDDGTFFGMTSKQDLIEHFAEFDPNVAVDANMAYINRKADSVTVDDLMKDAVDKLLQLKYKKILVLDKDKRPVGWLWKGEAQRWLLRQK